MPLLSIPSSQAIFIHNSFIYSEKFPSCARNSPSPRELVMPFSAILINNRFFYSDFLLSCARHCQSLPMSFVTSPFHLFTPGYYLSPVTCHTCLMRPQHGWVISLTHVTHCSSTSHTQQYKIPRYHLIHPPGTIILLPKPSDGSSMRNNPFARDRAHHRRRGRNLTHLTSMQGDLSKSSASGRLNANHHSLAIFIRNDLPIHQPGSFSRGFAHSP